MYKFVFLFCATFLLAGVVHADDSNEESEESKGFLETTKESLDVLLDDTIQKIEEKIKHTEDKKNEFIKELKKEAAKVHQSVFDDVNKDNKKASEEINQALQGAGDANVTECRKMADEISSATAAALKETGKCVSDIIEDAERHVTNIIRISNIVLKNLTHTKDEAKACVQQVDGITSSAKAIWCLNSATLKGTWATVTKVPGLFINVSKLTIKMYALMPRVSLCSTVGGVQIVRKNTQKVVGKVRDCIAQKLAEAEAGN